MSVRQTVAEFVAGSPFIGLITILVVGIIIVAVFLLCFIFFSGLVWTFGRGCARLFGWA